MTAKFSRALTLASIGIAGILFLGFVLWIKGIWIPNRPDPAKYPIRGIDVSHHNGKIDWAKVKRSGVDFAFIKATEGSDWSDIRFPNNWTESKKAGVVRGAYHFFSTTSSGEAQALNFVQTVPSEKGMLPPVIDIEFAKSKSKMTEDVFFRELDVMKQVLENRYGVEPIIYTTREFHGNYFSGQEIDNLWAREISGRPKGWAKNWMFWQFSNRGRVPGMAGRVDLNVYRKKNPDFVTILTR